MEIIDKKIKEILICPNCHSKIFQKENYFFCSKCKAKFFFKDNIFSFLPNSFKTEKDFKFKEEQINFFEEWSDRKRTNQKFKKNSFESFFFSNEKGSRINFSEKEIKNVITKLPTDSIVLELGCGDGEHTSFIAKLRNDIHLIAIDISPKSVLETKERIKADKKIKCKISYLIADSEFLPFKEKCMDCFVVVMFFHHVFSPDKSIKEIYRVLSLKGSCLIVDIVSNNPLNTLPRKIFPIMPISLKKRFKDDYVLNNGEIPLVSLHSIENLKKIVETNKMKISSEKRYDLFVFIFYNLTFVLPFIKYLFTRPLLEKIYKFECKLLEVNFFNKFAGVISLCISRN